MIALRLCWTIFALWHMWCRSTHLVISAQTTDANFEIEKGIRYGCGVASNRSDGSIIECAAECAKEESCYGFNFLFSQCQLLSATADERITAPGWTHGHYPTGNECTPQSGEPFDCAALNTGAQSGLYTIYTQGKGHTVFCDMETDSGGWTVIQRRRDGCVSFNNTYEEYEEGFGWPTGVFWIGNHLLHTLTSNKDYTLRIELEDFEGNHAFAVYSRFAVGSKEEGFRLTVGGYSGTAGDGIGDLSGQRFSTFEKDQDTCTCHCSGRVGGGWWFANCGFSFLNGMYVDGGTTSYKRGIIWCTWKGCYYSLKRTEMKIRPNN